MENFISLIEANRSDRTAIAAPDRTDTSFAALGRQIAECRRWFNAHGIGRRDRVAVVLPNCAEAATAFLAVAGAAGALLGYATSFLVVRGSDLARLMVTLGIGLMLFEVANQAAFITGGADGLSGVTMDKLFGVFAFDLRGSTAYL
jgi:ABC-type branched-subunit amino acid transport system permease subunit